MDSDILVAQGWEQKFGECPKSARRTPQQNETTYWAQVEQPEKPKGPDQCKDRKRGPFEATNVFGREAQVWPARFGRRLRGAGEESLGRP